MNIDYHHWRSPNMSHDMELKVYGQAGRPVLVFPAMGGTFYEFEDFGMLEAVAGFIEEGKIRLFTVGSADTQSWANWNIHPADRARRHADYDRYITLEVIPFIRQECGNPSQKAITTGCSMGGYHAGNFFFRHPDCFDAVITLSGVFSLKMFVGDYMDQNIYFNSPLDYLRNLEDPWFLDQYRQSKIIICAGQGAWEGPMIADALAMEGILRAKGVPAWIDLWGYDVNHDWPWWRIMLPYFLGHIL